MPVGAPPRPNSMVPDKLTLSGGGSMPALGFGTWGIQAPDIDASLRAAVSAGYRLFDLAPVYNNERAVGDSLSALFEEGVLTRDSIFLTSKVPPTHACSRSRILAQVRETLRNLHTAYLDLYLVHWPFCVRNDSPTWPPPISHQLGYSAHQLRQTWRTMEELMARGLVRNIGLSNIGLRRLQSLLASPDLRAPPAVIQVEHHPYNANRELRAFCAAAVPPIRITAYASLGSQARPTKYQKGQPRLLADPALQRVAAHHSVPAASIALGWALRCGVAVIPKSAHPQRIVENAGAVAVARALSDDEVRRLDSLDRDFRYLEAGWRGYAWREGMRIEELYDDPPPYSAWRSLPLLVGLLALCCCTCGTRRWLRGAGKLRYENA